MGTLIELGHIAVDRDRAILNLDMKGHVQAKLIRFPSEGRMVRDRHVERGGKHSTCKANAGHDWPTGFKKTTLCAYRRGALFVSLFGLNWPELAIRVPLG